MQNTTAPCQIAQIARRENKKKLQNCSSSVKAA
jgi:hypothetical protein